MRKSHDKRPPGRRSVGGPTRSCLEPGRAVHTPPCAATHGEEAQAPMPPVAVHKPGPVAWPVLPLVAPCVLGWPRVLTVSFGYPGPSSLALLGRPRIALSVTVWMTSVWAWPDVSIDAPPRVVRGGPDGPLGTVDALAIGQPRPWCACVNGPIELEDCNCVPAGSIRGLVTPWGWSAPSVRPIGPARPNGAGPSYRPWKRGGLGYAWPLDVRACIHAKRRPNRRPWPGPVGIGRPRPHEAGRGHAQATGDGPGRVSTSPRGNRCYNKRN